MSNLSASPSGRGAFLSLAAARTTEEVAGVAWWAHVGGFVFGAAAAALFRAWRARKWRGA